MKIDVEQTFVRDPKSSSRDSSEKGNLCQHESREKAMEILSTKGRLVHKGRAGEVNVEIQLRFFSSHVNLRMFLLFFTVTLRFKLWAFFYQF